MQSVKVESRTRVRLHVLFVIFVYRIKAVLQVLLVKALRVAAFPCGPLSPLFSDCQNGDPRRVLFEDWMRKCTADGRENPGWTI